MSKQILVAVTSGWVFIGNEQHDANGALYLTDAACIRRWGTTAGLGEIALTGPTTDTVLDPCGVVVFPNPTVILFTLPCS